MSGSGSEVQKGRRVYTETTGRPQRSGSQKPERVLLLVFADLCGDQMLRISVRLSLDFPFLMGSTWRGVLLNVWSSSIGKCHKNGGN